MQEAGRAARSHRAGAWGNLVSPPSRRSFSDRLDALVELRSLLRIPLRAARRAQPSAIRWCVYGGRPFLVAPGRAPAADDRGATGRRSSPLSNDDVGGKLVEGL